VTAPRRRYGSGQGCYASADTLRACYRATVGMLAIVGLCMGAAAAGII